MIEEKEKLFAYIVRVRRDLHRTPELSGQEYHTGEYIAAQLKSMGLEVRRAHTGVMADIKGSDGGRTIAFRADFDALPIKERTGAEYASENCNMHACGHDGHTAMLLGAAKYLTEHQPKNNIRLIFQYGEEGEGGAVTMINGGALVGVDNIFAFHLCPEVDKGRVATNRAALFAGVVEFDVVYDGVSSHCATKEAGKDALASLIEFVYCLPDCGKGYGRTLLHTGRIVGGSARNVVADTGKAECTFRYYDEAAHRGVMEKVYRIVETVGAKYGTQGSVNIHCEYPPLINHADSVDMLESVTQADEIEGRYTAEDFAFYLKKVSGCMAWLGVRDEYHSAPLHSDKFDFDESVLLKGTEVFIKLANL